MKCTSMRNLATPGCDLVLGHDGPHKNARGDEWEG